MNECLEWRHTLRSAVSGRGRASQSESSGRARSSGACPTATQCATISRRERRPNAILRCIRSRTGGSYRRRALVPRFLLCNRSCASSILPQRRLPARQKPERLLVQYWTDCAAGQQGAAAAAGMDRAKLDRFRRGAGFKSAGRDTAGYAARTWRLIQDQLIGLTSHRVAGGIVLA
jgi:hypothetical protein